MNEKKMSPGLKILRWIAVLPSAIILYLAIYWFNIFMGRLWWESAFAVDIVATAFANIITPTVIAIKVAPSFKKVVLIVLCLLIIAFTGVSTYLTIANPNMASTKLIILQVVGIISAILPIAFTWKISSEEF